jgi:hypothetical protein
MEAEGGEQTTFVGYSTFLLWIPTIALIVIGGLLLLAAPLPGACFVAIGAVFLVILRNARRIGERALVLDDKGLDYAALGMGARYHIPWGEITGAHAGGTSGVWVQLRAPRSRFRVPPREPRRNRDRGSLFLPDTLNISARELVGLIQAHLPDADEGTEA